MQGLIIFSIAVIHALQTTDFKEDQLRFPRVRNAYQQKGELINEILKEKSIDSPNIFIRLFKQEEVVEVWAKEKTKDKYTLLNTYSFCSTSGKLGPKRRQGDMQIPEGFYFIDRFNPSSNFYLSLGIDYPNKSDRILGAKNNLGGDIFIHGDCVTIGCVPITDDKIMELYVLAVEAKNNGQERIPVHIFPAKLKGEEYEQLLEENKHNIDLINFWKSLKSGFDYFETYNELPTIEVSDVGKYYIDK